MSTLLAANAMSLFFVPTDRRWFWRHPAAKGGAPSLLARICQQYSSRRNPMFFTLMQQISAEQALP